MAVYSNHPVSAPPVAPLRERTGHLALRGWCVFVLFLAFAGPAPIYAFGNTIAFVMAGLTALVSVGLWIFLRPPLRWRRLPWLLLAFIALATASLAWSGWRSATAVALVLLYVTTACAFFVASVLSWRDVVLAIAAALKWALGLSLVFELWVSLVIRSAILPGGTRPLPGVDPIGFWSRNNLIEGGRIQGIVGSGNLLGALCVMGVIVFSILIAARVGHRSILIMWIVLAVYLGYRAFSATAILAAAGVAVVAVTALLMRSTHRPGERTRYYIAYGLVGVLGVAGVWLTKGAVFEALGRSDDLTGRERIWGQVLERASEHPVAGGGFSTPWMPWDPAFNGWIIDHGQTVLQAHNVWVDVFFQLGWIGVITLALVYLAYIWRSWFFAVDRPRWDLRDDRPFSAFSLLPTLTIAFLLVQGLAESAPLMLWGWTLTALFSFKIKQSPFVGVSRPDQGPSPRS